MGILCGPCKSIVKVAIKAMPSSVSCAGGGALLAAAIDAAGGGPEDPIADALAVVAVSVFETYCNKYGWKWIQDHSEDFAEAMCKAADLC